jgi:hypothetical protein
VSRKNIFSAALAGAAFFASITFAPPALRAERPAPEAVAAFDRYASFREQLIASQLAGHKNFLWIDALPPDQRDQSYADLKRGQTIIRPFQDCQPRCTPAPGALIHDWVAIVFVPGVTLPQTLTALQNYDRDLDYYSPEVQQSKLLAKSGDTFRVFLRLQQKHLITVVLDTEYQIQYTTLDNRHAASLSRSTKISEVENAGSPEERALPPDDSHGFLWRLNSYWRFYQADGGVYIQCNALSLSRNVPAGLGWLVGSYIENIPRESLQFTLTATRKALLDKSQNRPIDERREEKQTP